MAKKRPTTPKAARAAKTPTDLLPKGYAELLGQLKERIRSAQLRAVLAVNREMVLLYWQNRPRHPRPPGARGMGDQGH